MPTFMACAEYANIDTTPLSWGGLVQSQKWKEGPPPKNRSADTNEGEEDEGDEGMKGAGRGESMWGLQDDDSN